MGRSFLWLLILFCVLVTVYHGYDAHAAGEHTIVEYAVQDDYKTAKDKLLRELQNDPFNTPARSSLKIIEDVLNNKIKPETAVLLLKGIEYYNKGNSNMAITLFSKAILAESDYAVSYMNRGLAYALAGQHKLAISDYNKTIDMNPEYVKAYISRGIAHAKKGQYDLAIADYDKSAEIDSSDADVYYNRAVAYTKKGLYDRAILDYDKTIEINPQHANAYINLGLIHLEHSGDKKKACSDWKQACNLGSCSNYSLAQKEGYCE